MTRSLVPGTGFEPVFLDSETSVVAARRSRNEIGPRALAREPVGPEGLEPSPTRLRGGSAHHYATDPSASFDAVGREGLEPSPLGLKARCSSIELASRARTIAFEDGSTPSDSELEKHD